ncbi:hypothetical protein BGX34_008290 [Mortierella sp. NVP85]|nr:hypothetical protein BGX34_008290 [Mortierella sp. NVP85]
MSSPLGPFDQVVAVSQKQINNAFFIKSKIDSTLANITIENDWGSINSSMNAPSIVLCVPGDHTATTCRFQLNFKEGTFKYNPTPQSPVATTSVNGWTLAWNVNLGLSALEDPQIPQNIREKIIIPGTYSVSQLFLDFTLVDVMKFDPEHSSVPGLDPKALPSLSMFLGEYFRLLEDGSHHGLGYATTVSDPVVAHPQAPTFPLTALAFQTMASTDNNPDHNVLLFLEMTGNRPLPSIIPILPPYAWADSESETMAITGSKFAEYLANNTKFINLHALNILNDAHHWVVDRSGLPTPETWILSNDKDSNSIIVDWNQSTGTSRSFNWSSTTKGDDSTGFWSKLAGSAVWSTESSLSVDLSVVPGTDKVTYTVTGKSTRHHSSASWGTLSSGSQNVSFSFVITLTLTSVKDGMLESTWSTTDPVFQASIKDLVDDNQGAAMVVEELHRYWTTEGLVNHFKSAMAQQPQFVFPGAGTFVMKNPRFNQTCDVTVQFQYMN